MAAIGDLPGWRETPAARFGRGLADIRLPDPARLAEAFLWREDRWVDKTGQVPLQGNRYEVDPRLAGRRVQLRYDPFDLSVIQVWYDGRRFDDARPCQLVRGHDQRVSPPAPNPVALPDTRLSYLELLLREHRDEARSTLGRIAFHRAGPDKEDDSDV